jgi:hypothetical protein
MQENDDAMLRAFGDFVRAQRCLAQVWGANSLFAQEIRSINS